jgi:hypothetical protein
VFVACCVFGCSAPSGCVVFALFAPTNRVTVVNASGQTAHDVRMTACGVTTELGDIPPGGSASARFGTPSDDDYIAVHGYLKDGTAIDEPSCVYIVWEEYFRRFVIVIRADGTASPRY